jgi:hypothetical protein
MSRDALFYEVINSLIDTTAEYSVYEASGRDVFERCDWDYDNIYCSDCNKYEKRYICRDKYEILLKVYKNTDSGFRNEFHNMYNKFDSTTEEEKSVNMKKVIDIYLEDNSRSPSSNYHGNYLLEWSECKGYEYI